MITGQIYRNETFTGELSKFNSCEFHDCIFERAIVRDLTNCALYSTKIIECDFTNADVSFSTTNNCETRDCKWVGVRMVMDCGWLGGLNFGSNQDAFMLLVGGLIPKHDYKNRMESILPPNVQRRYKAILSKPIRRV